MIILRLSRPTALITAAVFEELFTDQLGGVSTIRHADSHAWCRAVLGPAGEWSVDAAASRFDAALDGADFVAPNYEAVLIAPLLLAARNRARSTTRLLLVAHAPGAWPLEWALMGPLMAPGDLIVAPSLNAADLIAFLNPDLLPFITVIPHPMAPLDSASAEADATERIVSLGRIHPGKLLHRQIESLDVLRRRGGRIPLLEIAGAAQTPAATEYLASLKAKVQRLGLEAHVRFVGVIQDRLAKSRFLAGAKMLLNLSVSIEESFGKAPIEALGCGIPVLGTRWNGLPEVIGDCGRLLDVDCARPGIPADVSAECIADGVQELLDAPPSPAACRSHAALFSPAVALPRYRAVLETGAEIARSAALPEPPPDAAPAAPRAGLLAAAAPLTAMSWRDLFRAYVESCDDLRRSWESARHNRRVQVDGVLFQGLRAPIEQFLAGGTGTPSTTPPAVVAPGNYMDQVAAAARSATSQLSTRVACLVHLWEAGRIDDLLSGLQSLEGHQTPAVRLLRAEAARLTGDLNEAFERASQDLDLHSDDAVTAFRLGHIASIAREAGRADRALMLLGDWLERFPDSPDSGRAWLELSITAFHAGDRHHSTARMALFHARTLIGETPTIHAVERQMLFAEAADAVGEHAGAAHVPA